MIAAAFQYLADHPWLATICLCLISAKFFFDIYYFLRMLWTVGSFAIQKRIFKRPSIGLLDEDKRTG